MTDRDDKRTDERAADRVVVDSSPAAAPVNASSLVPCTANAMPPRHDERPDQPARDRDQRAGEQRVLRERLRRGRDSRPSSTRGGAVVIVVMMMVAAGLGRRLVVRADDDDAAPHVQHVDRRAVERAQRSLVSTSSGVPDRASARRRGTARDRRTGGSD